MGGGGNLYSLSICFFLENDVCFFVDMSHGMGVERVAAAGLMLLTRKDPQSLVQGGFFLRNVWFILGRIWEDKYNVG